MNQKVYIGKNAIAEWLSEMRTIAPKHCFVVRGHRSFEACGGHEVIEKLQNETHCQITEFEDFSVNPKYEEAQVGMEKLLQSNADMIIAIGGGSVMDMAKLIRHMAAEQGYIVPLHAIPTTAGTGAEATHFAVVYIDGKKQSISADDVLPDVAVVYPSFTYSNNIYQTACAGFDAVAQAIESFWAKGATEESRDYSKKALGLLWNQLPQLVQNPTKELRDQVAEGANWAGRAINISTTTAPHAFSYAFTSHYGYPHGHAVALTFPFFMKLNGTKELYEILGFSSIRIIPQMEAYIESLGLSLALDSTVDVLSTLKEVNLQRLSNNPVEVTQEILIELERYLIPNRELIDMQQEDFSVYNGEGTQLRKAQLRMLEILKAVDAICRENSIPYFIEAGTLLGAVRHGGFIPWDDDLDICVLRTDYNRLRGLLKDNLPSSMVFQDAKTDPNYPLLIGKVRDTKSYFEEDFSAKLKYGGIYIDIFPIEKVPSWKWKQKLDYIYGHCVRALHNYTDKNDKIRSAIVYPFAKIIVAFTRFANHFISTDKVAYQYGREGYGQYHLSDIFPLQEISFEGFSCLAPHNPDALLKTCYRDYMQIPPKEKRLTHTGKIEFYDE